MIIDLLMAFFIFQLFDSLYELSPYYPVSTIKTF